MRGSHIVRAAANIPIDNYRAALEHIDNGVYWGLAAVGVGPVYPCALNVGWSPFYGVRNV